MWTPELDPAGPSYLAITRALEADVRSGRLAEGARLPTHRALARALGVNVGTVSRAYAEAQRRGLLAGEVGRGTFVKRGGRRTLTPHQGAVGLVDLSVNVPLEAPGPDLRAALRALADRPDLDAITHYREPAGSARARAAGALWLRHHGVSAGAEDVVVVNGSQHGILVALAALAGPGECVLAEALAYPGFRAAARLLGLRVRGVPMDEHGLLPAALEAACADRPRLLYCTPALQNPTTAVLPAARRAELVAIARAHDLAIVVDDVQAPMLGGAAPSLASLAPERVVTIAGLSKLLVPGLRTAFVAGPRERTARLAEIVWSSTWMASPLGAELAAGWIEEGTAERVAAERAEEMKVRERLARRILGGGLRSQPGSYHVWLELPEGYTAAATADRLLREGVAVTPAEAFLAAPGAAPEAIRISLSAPREIAALGGALEKIAAALDSLESAPNDVRL
jgi:DNA-binding transcriptional MocR family regulator